MGSRGWREWSALVWAVGECKHLEIYSQLISKISQKFICTDELNSTEICYRNRPGVFSRVKCFVRWIRAVQRRIERQSKTSTKPTSATTLKNTETIEEVSITKPTSATKSIKTETIEEAITTKPIPRTPPPQTPTPAAWPPQTKAPKRQPRERKPPKKHAKKNLHEKKDKPPDPIGMIGHSINEITKIFVKPLELFGIQG